MVNSIIALSVNNRAVKQAYVAHPRDHIVALLALPMQNAFVPRDLPLTILYEDEALLVLNKESGIAVHPSASSATDELTIAHALAFRYTHLLAWEDVPLHRGGIVHRLDKATSGVMIVAKERRAAELLQRQFKERRIKKRYLAALYGHLSPPAGEISSSIARDQHARTRFVVAKSGRSAHTIYKVLKIFDRYTMVKLMPTTGRTHQLRVHMCELRHPIVGDRRYAPKRAQRDSYRLLLHAQRITFVHPYRNIECTFSAPLPTLFHSTLRGELKIS